VVRVKMRVYDAGDVVGGHPDLRQPVEQQAVLPGEHALAGSSLQLVAHPRLHEDHVFATPDEHAVEAERDAVLGVDVVTADHRFPHDPRDEPEHGPAIQPERAVGNDGDVELTHPVTCRAFHALKHMARARLRANCCHVLSVANSCNYH
jgi:hypothetical protein